MSLEGESKTCKMCRMAIPADARKCPFCLCLQGRYAILYNPLIPTVVFLVFFLVMLGIMGTMLERTFSSGEPFAPYIDQIAVSDTRISFGEDQCGPVVVVIGKLRNSSPVDWKDVRFQAVFFNANGELMDAGQQESYAWRAPQNEEVPFKVSFRRQFPEEAYAGPHKVRVISASDARKRF